MKKITLAVGVGFILALIVATSGAGSAPVVSADNVCRLDKIGTWSEVQGAGSQTIEVGGSGFQHLDLYSHPGARTVSYITERAGRVGTFSGHGSAWEGANLTACGRWEDFDWVGDATQYQLGRGSLRGSGLVANVNVRDGVNYLVAHVNAFRLSQAEVCSIIAEQTVAWRFDNSNPIQWVLDEVGLSACSGGAPILTVGVAVTPPPAPAPQAGNCEPAVREDRRLEGLATWWGPTGVGTGEVIVLFWTNLPGKLQTERKLRLRPADGPVQLLGGGSSWLRPAGCSQAADNEFRGTPLLEVSLSQLREEGLAR